MRVFENSDECELLDFDPAACICLKGLKEQSGLARTRFIESSEGVFISEAHEFCTGGVTGNVPLAQ